MENHYALHENTKTKSKFSFANLAQLFLVAVLIGSAAFILILFEDIINVSIYVVYSFIGLIMGIAAVQLLLLLFRSHIK
jgi:hypothetical protein